MAISSSSSSSSSDNKVQNYSKQCLESFKTLQKNFDSKREKHNIAKLEIQGYELALESLESRILGHEKNEIAWGEKYKFQNYNLKCREIKINNLKIELEKVVKERDELKVKIEKWEESSKSLYKLLNGQMNDNDKNGLGYGTQIDEMSNKFQTDCEISMSIFKVRSSDEEIISANDKFSKVDGYHAVPPPITKNFLTPRADISFAGLDEFAIRKKIIKSKTTELKTDTSKSKTSETIGNTNEVNNEKPKPSVSATRPSVTTASPSVITVRPVCTARPSISTARPVYATRPFYPRMDNVRPRGSCSPIKRSYYTKPAFRPKDLKQDVKTFGVQNMTTAGTRAVVNTSKGKLDTDLKKSRWVWRPKGNYMDHVSKNSGSFMLKKGNPDILLQDHAVVDSGCSNQMTGNKAYLSNFKLLDESQVVHRAPRKDDVYSLDLKNIVPFGGITYLYANAIADESKLWHRRLGHVNFKNINNLVKGHLVRGLPLKVFVNDHTCVACKKDKQHKASCKAKLERIIRKPLELLHMDLFGPVSVESINKKRCDNGIEFKNHAINEFCAKKGIKREFSVARTSQQNEAVNTACYVLNRVLVTKPQNKTPYELLIGKSPSISFMRPFGCTLTILNTLDSLGKFDGKSNEGYLLRYSTFSKAFRVYNKRTKRVEENLHINFLEDQPNVTGTGPNWMFDLDFLTNSMNYIPVSVENQVNVDAGTQDSYVAGSSGKDKGPTQEYILLPLQPHRTRIPIEDVALAAHEKPSESSPKDNDIQDSEDVIDKEGQHQMPEDEQVLHDELEKMVTQELTAKAMDDVSRQAFKEEKRRIASQKKAAQATSTNKLSTDRQSVSTDRQSVSTDRPFVSTDRPFVSTDRSNTPYVSAASTPTGANAGESSFVYLGGKIPIDASTLPNADLPIDLNMPDLEDASDTLPNDGIFNGAYDDEDVGVVADFNNMDNTIAVSPIPTLRIHKDHPKGQISKEPRTISQALQDKSWVEAKQEELLQFKLQKVWVLVDLPYRKK
ncbi:putative ribonuclease H-like domain-containing protein, partial [Tanacetum coccineum]